MSLFEKKTARIAGDQAEFARIQGERDRELAFALRDGTSITDEPLYGQDTALFLKGAGSLFPAGIAEIPDDKPQESRTQVTP